MNEEPLSPKKRAKIAARFDQEYWRSIEDLADFVVMGMKDEYRGGELEPFEHYSKRLKLRLVEDMDKFRQRFVKGYQVILEGIQEDFDKENSPDG